MKGNQRPFFSYEESCSDESRITTKITSCSKSFNLTNFNEVKDMFESAIKIAIQNIKKEINTVDPFEIVKKLNIDIKYMDVLGRNMSYTIYPLEEPVIIINPEFQSDEKRYYAVAHELGYIYQKTGIFFTATVSAGTDEEIELHAKIFAKYLLINFFKQEHGHPINDLSDLSIYGYPLTDL